MKVNETATRCTICGLPAEIRLDDFTLCDRCYIERGSCCTEFEPDDEKTTPEI